MRTSYLLSGPCELRPSPETLARVTAQAEAILDLVTDWHDLDSHERAQYVGSFSGRADSLGLRIGYLDLDNALTDIAFLRSMPAEKWVASFISLWNAPSAYGYLVGTDSAVSGRKTVAVSDPEGHQASRGGFLIVKAAQYLGLLRIFEIMRR